MGDTQRADGSQDCLDEGDLCLILIDQVDAALVHIGQRVVAR
ncbi:hypothetical protein [Denitromonas iodatirespirans]|nr:hypothetical protein [Denitromonas iodatirespirans]